MSEPKVSYFIDRNSANGCRSLQVCSFSSPHPRVLSAIHSLNYGNLEKLYLTFPSAWWLSPSSNNPPTSPAVFTFPSSTTHMIFSLFHLPPPLSHPTLLCYLYPPLSDRMFLPTPISPDYVSSLISLLPNYSPTNPSCTPTSVIATGWSKDEFAGWGSYTNFQVGLKDGVRELQVLKGFGSSGAEGGNQGEWENGGVWFAGEHVAPDERSLATVGGAWESGEEVARRVVKWLEERAKLP